MKQRSATRARPQAPKPSAAPAAPDATQDHDASAFPIVGIGASAGGLDAYRTFFSTVPADCGAAFVLIQHLDPTRKSMTADLVGSYTAMPVVQAEEGMRVEVDYVYVIPPNAYLAIDERVLRLSAPVESRSLRMAIDFFFESLAAAEQERSVGIILSGSGTDGTLGLKRIKAAGGLTMVQDPKTAQHDGMPRSAIASADHVLSVDRMGPTLLAHLHGVAVSEAPGDVPSPPASHALLDAIAVLQARTSFDFSGYKKGTLQRRLQHRMSLRRIAAIDDYTELLRTDPDEAGQRGRRHERRAGQRRIGSGERDGRREVGRRGVGRHVHVAQRALIVLILRLDFENDVELVGLRVDRRDLPLAERVVERVVDVLRGNAEAAGGVAIDLHQ